jgi:hypothetical protein
VDWSAAPDVFGYSPEPLVRKGFKVSVPKKLLGYLRHLRAVISPLPWPRLGIVSLADLSLVASALLLEGTWRRGLLLLAIDMRR